MLWDGVEQQLYKERKGGLETAINKTKQDRFGTKDRTKDPRTLKD